MKNIRLVKIPMLLILLLYSLQAVATSVLPISLQRMAAAADTIFHGKTISNEVKLDSVSGNVATFTTFEIIELIKGKAGATRTIKQIGGQLPGSDVRQLIHGVPRFSTGQEYVVFLPKASDLGFSSPIGLSQGKFDVHKINGKSVIKSQRALAAAIPQQQVSPDVVSAIELGQATDPGIQLPGFLQGVRAMLKE